MRGYWGVPEPGLEPPEDQRTILHNCVACGEPIREYDEAYDIPGFGYVCTRCVDDAHVVEVTE